jgi:hypothetical protein
LPKVSPKSRLRPGQLFSGKDAITAKAREDHKPDSVPPHEAAVWSFVYAIYPGPLRPKPGGAGHAIGPLFDLAPGGVCHAAPLARPPGGLLHHLFTLAARLAARGGIFSVALSVDADLAASLPRSPRDTLPCGVRTFLPAPPKRRAATSPLPRIRHRGI